ncbi:hypothetical protein MNAN1_002317 [Malassezia nana]|uniref:BOD1/SHG1 domain-containing protein n=1 Tax=Malassezia nana TaxID=180528 RepID=A0AAF0J2P5_9BASI|nr:hypothetical protein MNAN1_002317 [Malassezia nana]
MNQFESTLVRPETLVDEFKRQGHFDQIRKSLFQAFLQSEQHAAFRAEAEAFLKGHVMAEVDRMVYRDARLRHSDLMHALDQQPFLDQLLRELCRNGSTGEGLLSDDSPITHQIREQVMAMVPHDVTEARPADVA